MSLQHDNDLDQHDIQSMIDSTDYQGTSLYSFCMVSLLHGSGFSPAWNVKGKRGTGCTRNPKSLDISDVCASLNLKML